MNARLIALIGVVAVAASAWPAASALAEDAKGGNPFGTPIALMNYSANLFLSADAGQDVDNVFRDTFPNPLEPVFIATDSDTVSATDGNRSASASADYSTNFSLDLGSGILTGTFIAEGQTSAINFSDASYSASFEVQFGVESESASIQIFGQGAASGFGEFGIGRVHVSVDGDAERETTITGVRGMNSGPISETLEVGRGTYFVRFEIEGEVFYDEDEDHLMISGSSNVSVNLTVTPHNTEQETITWTSGQNGSFDDPENWDPENVPSSDNIAVFGNGGLYDVSFGEEASRRAIVRDTLVRWVGGSYELSGGTEVDPSLVVGTNSTNDTTLGIDGTQVSSVFASIGEVVGSNALVSVINGAVLNNSARLVVGESGTGSLDNGADGSGRIVTGELRIGENAQAMGLVEITGGLQKQVNKLDAGATAIGHFGEGTLVIDDAEVETGQTSIGALFDSIGEVTVEGDLGIAQWVFGGELRVGDEGRGTLNIFGGSVMSAANDRVVVGFLEGSNGSVFVSGTNASLTTFSEIAVGTDGTGSLAVHDGGFVEGSVLIIGPSDGPGDGTVTVTGAGDGGKGIMPSMIMAGDELIVGAGGPGRLELNGGQVFAVEASFGEFADGNANVRVFNGGVLEMSGAVTIGDVAGVGTAFVRIERQDLPSFLIGDTVTLHANSSVVGNGGVLRTTNGFTNMGGTIVGVVVDAAKQNGGENGLMIEGDFAMTGGVIEVEVAGLSASEVGMVHVTGDAMVSDAEVKLVFVDGFLPQASDEFPFLMVDGALAAQNLSLTYEGAAPGFQFDVDMENGMLVFNALNDAQPLTPGGRCASGGAAPGEFGLVWALTIAGLILWHRKARC